MTFELTKDDLRDPGLIMDIICHCEIGDTYILKETGEILFQRTAQGMESTCKEFLTELKYFDLPDE